MTQTSIEQLSAFPELAIITVLEVTTASTASRWKTARPSPAGGGDGPRGSGVFFPRGPGHLAFEGQTPSKDGTGSPRRRPGHRRRRVRLGSPRRGLNVPVQGASSPAEVANAKRALETKISACFDAHVEKDQRFKGQIFVCRRRAHHEGHRARAPAL